MATPVKSRPYRSPLRDEQAAATRGAVLAAARDLFTTRGYAAATVAEVARRARVSVDTVYASVGRKPQLLLAVHDMALAGTDEPVDAEQRDYVVAIHDAAGGRAKLEVYAQALRARLPAVVPLAEALRVAARDDPACRAQLEALDARRAANMRLLAAELRATGDLREDISDDDVAHLLWTTTSPAYYLLATTGERGPRHYATMVLDVWTCTLLRPAAWPASD